jgi:phosphoesterase RecJ-like protein
MDQIIHRIKNANSIFIASHANPDGDAIGSLIAMGLAMNSMGKRYTLYNESIIPTVYRFLPSVESVVQHLRHDQHYDCAIILDCGNLQRIGQAAQIIQHVPTIINVDHHLTNTRFGHCQLIDTDACSTAEIVYHIIKALDISMTVELATAIYTGILTDTGSFRFSNTNRAAFAICDEMVDLGVDPYAIAQHVYGTYSMGRIKLLNLALDSIEMSPNGKLSMMTVTRDMLDNTNTHPEDVDGMINYAKRIKDVKVAALVQEKINGSRCDSEIHKLHVSLRSDGSVDVSMIASQFGGGGHSSAAGFNIDTSISDIKAKLLHFAKSI